MKKIKMLYILNVANRVNSFSYSSMLAAQNVGMEFHIAGSWGYQSAKERQEDEEKYGIKIHQVDFIRRPYDVRNFRAYKQVCRLIRQEKIDVIHCNTPIGGVVGRLAGKKCGVKTVIYQAHGFHFYKGAPLVNWMIYYPIEKWLAAFTDILITINQEDYAFVKEKMQLLLRKNGVVEYVPGVGMDTQRLRHQKIRKEQLCQGLSIPEDSILLISMGDLIPRKNYEAAIGAVAQAGNARLHYLICGEGNNREKLQRLCHSLNVSDKIHFLGFRSDAYDILTISDIFVNSSLQEGLPRSTMEAMSSGLPCIASRIRGNVDLLEDGKGGYLVSANDIGELADKLKLLCDDEELRNRMGAANLRKIMDFDIKTVVEKTEGIYRGVRG